MPQSNIIKYQMIKSEPRITDIYVRIREEIANWLKIVADRLTMEQLTKEVFTLASVQEYLRQDQFYGPHSIRNRQIGILHMLAIEVKNYINFTRIE